MDYNLNIMKTLITILLLFCSIFTANAQGNLETNHFACGTGIAAGANGLIWKWTDSKITGYLGGIAVGTFAGWMKEIYDRKNGGHYSNSDLESTFWGSALGSSVMLIILLPSTKENDIPVYETWLLEKDEEEQVWFPFKKINKN